MDNSFTPVTRYLTNRNLPFRIFIHLNQGISLKQAAFERDQIPEQIIRTIVFRCHKDQFIIVLMPGNHRVSWTALRKYIGKSRISMASEEEVLEATGYRLGAVAPLNLPSPTRILVDQSVLDHEEISIGSGKRGVAVIMKSVDLLDAIGEYELNSFSE